MERILKYLHTVEKFVHNDNGHFLESMMLIQKKKQEKCVHDSWILFPRHYK